MAATDPSGRYPMVYNGDFRRNDCMTMGATIKCRLPVLNYRLVEYAAAQARKLILEAGR